MKVTHKDSITVELSKQDIKKIMTQHFEKQFEGYSVLVVSDKTKTHVTQGADPHDAFYDELFDGLELTLGKKK